MAKENGSNNWKVLEAVHFESNGNSRVSWLWLIQEGSGEAKFECRVHAFEFVVLQAGICVRTLTAIGRQFRRHRIDPSDAHSAMTFIGSRRLIDLIFARRGLSS